MRYDAHKCPSCYSRPVFAVSLARRTRGKPVTSSVTAVVNPRRACARVTVVVLSVCLSVYLSVPALAASASVETSKQRYSRVSLRLFLD